MVKKNIIDAYVRFREIDNTIPDAVLDFMKDCAIEKIDNINKEKLATETKEKYYTSDHISDQYDKLTQDQKISVLHEAIDIMQQYNGRTRFTCIGMAMGYENYEGESTTWTKNKKHGK
jgi:hypothetical protein